MKRSFGSSYGHTSRAKSKTPIAWIAVLIAGILFLQHRHGDWPFDGSIDFGGSNQVDPADPDQPNDQVQPGTDSLLSDAFVVFIFEANEKTADQEMILRGADDFIAARGMAGKRIYDDDQAAAIPYLDFAKTKNVAPPMIAIVKSKTITHAAPFPSTYDELAKSIH